jgi:hypothetical protein
VQAASRAQAAAAVKFRPEGRADQNVGVKNHPHPVRGPTSFCAYPIVWRMLSFDRPTAFTLARDVHRPAISSSDSIITVTRSIPFAGI